MCKLALRLDDIVLSFKDGVSSPFSIKNVICSSMNNQKCASQYPQKHPVLLLNDIDLERKKR